MQPTSEKGGILMTAKTPEERLELIKAKQAKLRQQEKKIKAGNQKEQGMKEQGACVLAVVSLRS